MTESTRPPQEPKLSVISFLMLRKRWEKRPKPQPVFESEAERKLAVIISTMLRSGILFSASLVLLGGILYLSRYGAFTPYYQVFTGEPTPLRSWRGTLSWALTFHGRGIIQLGLLVLLATPVTRVATALVGFYLVGDRMYVVVASIVLATLIFSFVGIPG